MLGREFHQSSRIESQIDLMLHNVRQVGEERDRRVKGDAIDRTQREELIDARRGFPVFDLDQPSMRDGVFFVAFRRDDLMAQIGDLPGC
jgi:hypothetical protein